MTVKDEGLGPTAQPQSHKLRGQDADKVIEESQIELPSFLSRSSLNTQYK